MGTGTSAIPGRSRWRPARPDGSGFIVKGTLRPRRSRRPPDGPASRGATRPGRRQGRHGRRATKSRRARA
ncbi:MAG: hypothetical protein E6G21_12615 [Actinobacteria bacterium]|nr:MAG: hypothetical protein E6G21_12615 [Actinomycetota bacterium]